MLDLKRTILDFHECSQPRNHKNLLTLPYAIQCILGCAKINLNDEYLANLCVVV